jgi:hypothetical protein
MSQRKGWRRFLICVCFALPALGLQAIGDEELDADVATKAGNIQGYVRKQDLLPADTKGRGVHLGASLKLGTTGPGADITIGFNNKLSLRAGYNYFSNTIRSDGEEEYDDDETELLLKLETAPVLLDWHPFSGPFRLSVGAVYNNNQGVMTVWPVDTYDFNDVDYQVERYDLKIAFEPISPYIGLGFGNAAHKRRRLAFAFDLGVIYHGAPQVSMQAIASNPAQQSALDRDVDAEVADLEDTLKAISIYPVITFGLSYCF